MPPCELHHEALVPLADVISEIEIGAFRIGYLIRSSFYMRVAILFFGKVWLKGVWVEEDIAYRLNHRNYSHVCFITEEIG